MFEALAHIAAATDWSRGACVPFALGSEQLSGSPSVARTIALGALVGLGTFWISATSAVSDSAVGVSAIGLFWSSSVLMAVAFMAWIGCSLRIGHCLGFWVPE